MLEYFENNSLSLNLSKSGFLIVNGKDADHKIGIELNNGILEYKEEIIYLGVCITDSGSLNKDVEQYVINKRSNISIKYNNFCRKHFTAPLDIKLTVLNACANT